MSQQTISVNLIGNSTALTGALRKASTAWKEIDIAMNKVMSGQLQYNGELGRFTAQNGKIVAGLGGMRQRLAEVKAEKERLAKTVRALSNEFTREELEILGLGDAMRQVNQGMRNVHTTAGSAQFAVTSLGQTFADSGQFGMGMAQGFRAINNNVQMLAQSMVMAAKDNGGFTKGLKAMGAAFMGPTGVLALFFAATAAIEFFANRSQKAQRGADELAKSLQGLTSSASPEGFKASAAGLKMVADASEAVYKGISAGFSSLAKAAAASAQTAYDQAIDAGFDHDAAMILKRKRMRDLLAASKDVSDAVSAEAALWKEDSEEKRKAAEDAEKLERAYNRLVVSMGVDGVLGAMQAQSQEFAESNWIQKQASLINDAITKTTDLKNMLELMQGPHGMRLAALKLEADELQRQVEWQQHLNDLQSRGVEVAGIDDIALRPMNAGIEQAQEQVEKLFRFAMAGPVAFGPGRFDWASIMGFEEMSAQMQEGYSQLLEDTNKFGEDFAKSQAKVAAENAKMEANFNKMGAGLISAAAGIGGGKREFMRAFGSFLSSWSKQLIQTGLAAAGFGNAMLAIKNSLSGGPAGAVAAIAAGVALAAIGRKLRASARAAANPGGGSGGGGGDLAAPGFTIPDRSIFSPGSTNAAYGGNSGIGVSGRFVVQGRDLVAVVQSESNFQSEMGINNILAVGN